jgi:hypothetical protein
MRTPALFLLALQASAPTPPAGARNAAPPFAVGERLEYSAKFGVLNVGSATIEVAGLDTLRGEPAWHFRFLMNASALFGRFKINSTIESWTTVDQFHSLRFRRENIQNGKQYLRSFEIFGDSGYYRQVEPEPLPPDASPSNPLDDASFLYFVRSTPLEVGKTYRFERYYWAARNPITIRVVKRQTAELPDGTRVPCLVLNPVVGETGLFGKQAQAQLLLTDDARRIPVEIRSRYSFGTVTLKLERIAGSGRP